MKCPHCGDVATHKTTQTLKFEGDVYRRRRCNACSGGFVTVETAPLALPMPTDPNQKARRHRRMEAQGRPVLRPRDVAPTRAKTVHPAQPEHPSYPTRLQDVWR